MLGFQQGGRGYMTGCSQLVMSEVGVGKLVEFYGDGDQSPFRGDRLCDAHMKLVVLAK